MTKSRLKKPNNAGRLFKAFLILLTLSGISTSAVGFTYAKYVTEGTASDEARVAVWAVTASLSDADIAFTADDKYSEESGSYYMFEIKPGNTEVASKYSVTVKLYDEEGTPVEWPSGQLEAKAVKVGGTGDPATSSDGVFADLGEFAAGDTDPVRYNLYFKADYAINTGEYGMEVTAKMEQID